MVYDMQNNLFPVDLDNVHSVLEIGQVCITDTVNSFVCAQLIFHSTLIFREWVSQ